ncbi:MAG: DEAD/DEAH box helicase family protein [Clostridia bacterium]|nr:DEAD/DEAH box helicase family protein [Clostridia bacterium]
MDIITIYLDNAENIEMPENAGNIEPLSALTQCLREKGEVDMSFLVNATGLNWSEVADALAGVIFQSPDRFLNGARYNPLEDWLMWAPYASGNVKEKLKRAVRAEKKFPGVFARNVEALGKICPMEMKLADIHPDVGAAWIPAIEYEQFLFDTLGLPERPSIYFIEERNKWVCEIRDGAKRTFANTTLYGVRGRYMGADKQYATAIDLFVGRLNAKTVEIFDHIPMATGGFGNFKYKPVLNREMTALAQEKEKNLCDISFKDWVFADAGRSARFENYYNDFLVGYVHTTYNGDFLTLPGINPEVRFFDNQKSAVARAILSDDNLLLAHDVGTGKTYEIIASVHELHRLGKSRKNLIVVQNQTLGDFRAAHNYLYPEDKILVIEPRDMGVKYRNKVLSDIRDGDYVAIYMCTSSFDLIDMSNTYYENKLLTQFNEARCGAANAVSSRERAEYESLAKLIAKRIKKFYEELKPSGFMTYEELGIETLVIDEIHTYKNITLDTHCKRIVGLRSKGSHKADSALEKAHFTPRLIGATATPLTNSIADLYTFQVYFQYDLLKLHKIHTFDAWINTFGERVTTIECDADSNANKLRAVSRFSHFHNLNELRALFAQVCDFYHAETKENVPECDGYTVVKVPINLYQKEGFEDISRRLLAIRRREVDKSEDNLLKINVDGRELALSAALSNPDAEGSYGKVKACASQVFRVYNEYPECTQLVFCDLGTPKEGYNVYDELKGYLVSMGMTATQIAFVHDATTERARDNLFARANAGDIKVIIGSVPKLGVGVNVQEKLVAIHHLTVPWKPSDLTQADGRIERFGNTCPKVFKYCYLTEKTYDQYSWQILENKQRFIASFMCGGMIENETADIGDTVLTYAEIKALTIGNPLIRDRVQVSIELERARVASRARQNELYSLRVLVETTPDKVSDLRINGFRVREDYEFYLKNREKITLPEREALGEELKAALIENEMRDEDRVFSTHHGFQVILPRDMTREIPFVYVSRPGFRRYYCALNNVTTNEGYSRALDQTLIQLKNRYEKLFRDAEELIDRMEAAKAEIRKGNPLSDLVDDLILKLEEIDSKLEAA